MSRPASSTAGGPGSSPGSPGTVRGTLEQMVAETGATEVVVQDLIADPVDRRRSHELLVEG